MQEIYYIGGSPCCGKSSIAELLAEEYDFQYYKLDDFLDPYMAKMAEDGNTLCRKTLQFSMEEMWMRDPVEMCREVIKIYGDMMPYAQAAVHALPQEKSILGEGAGFLPVFAHTAGIDDRHYVCCVPTREFQIHHYSNRPWIQHYLSGCSNPDKAFSNWMERDALFAEAMLEQAKTWGYSTIVVDGTKSIQENKKTIEKIFQLK